MVCVDNRIIQAISKHIIAQDALAGGNERIGIDESTHLRIVIAGLQIVEFRLSVLGLATIPDYALHTHTKPHGFRVGILLGS